MAPTGVFLICCVFIKVSNSHVHKCEASYSGLAENVQACAEKRTISLSTSLVLPAVAGCSRAETFSQLSSISFPQPYTKQKTFDLSLPLLFCRSVRDRRSPRPRAIAIVGRLRIRLSPISLSFRFISKFVETNDR